MEKFLNSDGEKAPDTSVGGNINASTVKLPENEVDNIKGVLNDKDVLTKLSMTFQDDPHEQEKKAKTSKRIVYYFITFIVVVLIVVIANFFQSGTGDETDFTDRQPDSSNVFFDAGELVKQNSFQTGKVARILSRSNNDLSTHKLVDESGQTITNIYSNTNDLNLSIGLTVEVEGTYVGSNVEGVRIFEVKKLKLK